MFLIGITAHATIAKVMVMIKQEINLFALAGIIISLKYIGASAMIEIIQKGQLHLVLFF